MQIFLFYKFIWQPLKRQFRSITLFPSHRLSNETEELRALWASQMGMNSEELLREDAVDDFMLQKKFFEDELERRKQLGREMAKVVEKQSRVLEEKEILREEHLVAFKALYTEATKLTDHLFEDGRRGAEAVEEEEEEEVLRRLEEVADDILRGSMSTEAFVSGLDITHPWNKGLQKRRGGMCLYPGTTDKVIEKLDLQILLDI